MGVEMLVGGDVAQFDARPRCDVGNRDLGPIRNFFLALDGCVDDSPVVVLVTVWVKGNLLFYTRMSGKDEGRVVVGGRAYVYCRQDRFGCVSEGNRLEC